MIKNNKGQESGTLQNLLLGLVVVTCVAVFGLSYIQGIGTNYNVAIDNESSYTVFQQFDSVNQTISGMTDLFNDESGQQGFTDIISGMVQSGYSLIKLVFNVPDIYRSLLSSGLISMGVSAGDANTIVSLSIGVIVIFILFAVVALVMKVRA